MLMIVHSCQNSYIIKIFPVVFNRMQRNYLYNNSFYNYNMGITCLTKQTEL